MTGIGDIKRILLLVIGFGAGMWMIGILLRTNQLAYTQPVSRDPYLHLQPTEQTAQTEAITFPFAVEGTNLVAEALVHYDGPLMEDGSGEELFNAVALLVRNTDSSGIAQARIVIEAEETWEFLAQDIPPQAAVLIVESSGAAFGDAPVRVCTGTAVTADNGWSCNEVLRIEQPDMGSIIITNTTQTRMHNIRMRYKNWLPQNEVFVGGISYEVCIDQLLPGQSVTLQPEHFAKGYSRFVRICWNEL